jgi:hypothetical protein
MKNYQLKTSRPVYGESQVRRVASNDPGSKPVLIAAQRYRDAAVVIGAPSTEETDGEK